jgi:hypothetical protein
MAEVSSDLVYEVLKQIQADTAALKLGQIEIKGELQAMRGHMVAMQQDIHNIYTTLARHDMRLDRIERRLELVEPAEV